jgi:hypothetical protein
MKKTGLIILTLILAISISCKKSTTGVLYTPTTADVTSTATLEELQQGKTLYLNNCVRCHDLYSPDAYTASEWKSIMPGMARNTKMTSTEVTLVTKYVTRGK